MSRFTYVVVFVSSALVAAMSSAARAAVPAEFTGGADSPLTFTLPGTVSYTATADITKPFFVFQGVGDLVHNAFRNAAGTITFSINGGTPQPLTGTNSGLHVGDIATNDIYFYGDNAAIATGDVVTLSTGTLTTFADITPLAPGAGTYETFIASDLGVRSSGAGAVPEPGAISSVGALLLGAVLRRPRRRLAR